MSNNPKSTVGAFYTLVIPALNNSEEDPVTQLDGGSEGQNTVRRPLDGMRGLEDTYATLSVKTGNKRVSLTNSSASNGKSTFTSNLMIQNTNFRLAEKVQTNQTFDQDRLFFFGKMLATLEVSAILIENESFQWLNEFYTNYVDHTSGTVLAETGTQAELRVEGKVFTGYITTFSFSRANTDLHTVQINFSMTIFDTKFTREIVHEATIYSYNDGALADEVFEELNDALTRARTVNTVLSQEGSNPEVALLNQLSYLSNAISTFEEETGVSPKKVSLRDSYPTEFVNSRSGKSKDLITSEVQARASAVLIQEQASHGISPARNRAFIPGVGRVPNIYAFNEDVRENILNDVIDKTITIRRSQRVVTDQGELYGVRYVPATATSTQNVSSALGGSPLTGLYVLAGTALVSAAIQEVTSLALSGNQSVSDFSIARVGEKAVGKILGTSLESILGGISTDALLRSL